MTFMCYDNLHKYQFVSNEEIRQFEYYSTLNFIIGTFCSLALLNTSKVFGIGHIKEIFWISQ